MTVDARDTGLRRILVGTDLGATADRAVERAALIARVSGAALTVVHVTEHAEEDPVPPHLPPWPSWTRSPHPVADPDERARRDIEADLGDRSAFSTVRIEHGAPGPILDALALEEQADLVVIGTSGVRSSRRSPLMVGRTGRHLLRRLDVPLLIVRNRARSTYRHVVVATDFSDASGLALQAAVRFFPDRPLHLLHACEPPYANLVSDSRRHADAFAAAARDDLERFLGTLFLPDERRRDLRPAVELGPPDALIRRYVRDFDADLVVMGTHGRGQLLEALVGSTAKGILSRLPCDALVVRGPRAIPRA